MPTLFLDKARAGMVLSKPALTEQGDVILNAGTVLDGNALADLSLLHLKYISVQDTPAFKVKKLKGSEARAEQELEERFSRAESSPLLLKIKEAIRAELKNYCKNNVNSG